MDDQTYYALALSLTPGLGRRKIQELLSHRGSPGAVLELTRKQLRPFRLSPEALASLVSGRSLRLADRTRQSARGGGIRIFSTHDQCYPRLLGRIHDPPLVLYSLGSLEALKVPAVAIVGSRRSSIYGKQVARKMARQLGELGLCVVSGLARGIDSEAHRGALEASGRTVAVLGSGVDVVYPRENRALYHRIRERGCLLSEFPCGSFPAPQNFPVRNRVISGLCYGTVIGEASEYSGSLITARLTLEQDRELWAIPGNVTSPGSYGPNYLLKQGAHVAVDAQDVVDELPLSVLDWIRSQSVASQKPVEEPVPAPGDLTGDEQSLMKLLPVDRALHVDGLLESSGWDLSRLNRVLLELEMKGLVKQAPGRRFARTLM